MAGSLIQVRATRLRQAHGTEIGGEQMHLTVRDVFARACLVIFGYQEDGSHSCGISIGNADVCVFLCTLFFPQV